MNQKLIYPVVRNIYKHQDCDKLIIETTDRLSSFDRHICDLKIKV